MQKKIELCDCCGAKLTGRNEGVSKGLALSLIKFRKKVLENSNIAGELVNKVHLSKDLNLSKNEYNNFQKLRYHGLIAHYKDKITKQYESGYWLLTKRGNLFCKNELAVSKKIVVFRNKIQEKSNLKVTFIEVMKDKDIPFWYSKEDFNMNFVDTNDYDEDKDDNQLELF